MKERHARETEYESMEIGESIEFSRAVDTADIDNFAELTGDFNPLHVDERYALKTKFKGRIVHGMLVASFFSTLVGMYLPGKKCLYLSQSLAFKRPLRPGASVKVKGIIVEKVDALKILVIRTEARNENNEIIVEGEAKVKVT